MTENVNKRLGDVILSLNENATGFRRRLEDAHLKPAELQTVDSLSKLPVLRKDDLIELQRQDPPFGGMLAVPIAELRRVFQSPGPINEPEPPVADAGRWASGLHAAGFQAGELVLNTFGYHLTPNGASLEDSLNSIGCVVIPGGTGNQEQQIQAMVSFGATGYVGLPSYLKVLLDKAEEIGVSLSVRRALVMAEPLPSSLRQELNEKGVEVYQAYGTAECGNLGYECDQLDGWHIPDDVIIQICDINTGEPLPHGETGEVVATLYNPYYAIVRFGVGDLSSINATPCGCGRKSLRLNGWQGRIGAATKVRGMFLHPTQLAKTMSRFTEVSRYQAVITREAHRDYLSLRVALTEEAEADTAVIVADIKKHTRDALKFRLDSVEVVTLAALPPDSSFIRDERTWE